VSVRLCIILGALLIGKQAYACDSPDCSCYLQVPALNFGNYITNSADAPTAIMNLTVGCSSNVQNDTVAYTISFSAGASGDYYNRYMQQGTSLLKYNLYADQQHLQVLGDGTNSTMTITGSGNFNTDTNLTNNHNIYAAIVPQQNATVGLYTDQVIVTIQIN
jgi:spore coat protein U-like protein